MEISKTIAELKRRPDFTEKVGMSLVHKGTVRAWSRRDLATVRALETVVDQEKVERLRQEYLPPPFLSSLLIFFFSGRYQPGDDLLFILVAGDVREHIKPVLAELLDRVKAEAVTKKEIPA